MFYSVQGDISAIEQHLSKFARDQMPFATALALTRTVQFAQAKIRAELPRIFDRPNKYTLNSLFIEPARKTKLSAAVKIKDDPTSGGVIPIRYLAPEIYGGARSRKGFERRLISAGKMPPNVFAVPASGAELDQYGNIRTSILIQMLSDLQAQFDVTANSTARSLGRRKVRRSRRPTFYFSTWPPNRRTQHLRAGVYRRAHFGFGAAIKPVLIFVSHNVYRKRFRFYEMADQISRMRFRIEFALAMRQAVMTARAG
jgi:hypothetical protein